MLTESPSSTKIIYTNDSQSVVSGPPAAVSRGNLLEMQILGPCYRLLGVGPAMWVWTPPDGSDALSSLRTTDLHCIWRWWHLNCHYMPSGSALWVTRLQLFLKSIFAFWKQDNPDSDWFFFPFPKIFNKLLSKESFFHLVKLQNKFLLLVMFTFWGWTKEQLLMLGHIQWESLKVLYTHWCFFPIEHIKLLDSTLLTVWGFIKH